MMTEWARVMDKLYLKGLSQLFTIVALGAAQRFGVATESVHLDRRLRVSGSAQRHFMCMASMKIIFLKCL